MYQLKSKLIFTNLSFNSSFYKFKLKKSFNLKFKFLNLINKFFIIIDYDIVNLS